LCFGGSGGSVCWDNLQKNKTRGGLINEGWLVDNIAREVGNGRETLFWRDMWFYGVLLEVSYRRLCVGGE